MKTCTRCKFSKPINNFVKSKSQKDGYHYVCKNCQKEYRILNDTKIKENNKKWNKNNKDKIKEYNLIYNKNNYSKKREGTDRWFENNPDYHKMWKKEKYINDINYRIKDNIRSRFYNALLKGFKISSVLDLLSCTLDEFKQHLEQQFKPEMNWDNHGEIWEIDHIIPCSSFDLTKIEEQQKCFHYTNHQPLFKTTQIAESFGYNEVGNRNKINKTNK